MEGSNKPDVIIMSGSFSKMQLLVDHSADKEYASLTEEAIQEEYQRAQERERIVHAIQDFFRQEPVERAWIFGSFSRMEERPDSDIDILIDLDSSAKVGLLYFAGIINRLQERLGRNVDLVVNGSIKPFALESINRDKVLVYERD